jgi:hypothetical protein
MKACWHWGEYSQRMRPSGVSSGYTVSKMEKRTDMYVSTLRSFVQAMGGELEIRAIFPDGTVKIDQFSALASREER